VRLSIAFAMPALVFAPEVHAMQGPAGSVRRSVLFLKKQGTPMNKSDGIKK
jgi:hypothetical protein